MPLVLISTNAKVEDAAREELLSAVSKLAAKALGKPEAYVMVGLSQASLRMGGKAGPAAFCDVRSVGGLGDRVNVQLSEQLCGLLHEKLSIPTERVYLNFTNVEGGSWGWNNETFG
jgi:phenylpyruvate tautomerase